jgi:hypothetical protein
MAFANKGMSLTRTTPWQYVNADNQTVHLCIFIYFFAVSTRGLKNCADLPKLLKNFVSNNTNCASRSPRFDLYMYNMLKLKILLINVVWHDVC